MKAFKIKLVAGLLFMSGSAFAQTEGHHEMGDSTSHENHQNMQMHDMGQMQHSQDVPMSHGFSLNLPMNRNGSGTGWLPDNVPMYGYMLHSKKWMYMIHGNIFLSYNKQDIGDKGTRGNEKVYAPNWFMAMGQTKVGKRGLFRLSTMLSLDPLTIGGSGYPLLFQSGETWKGAPLVDHQHPHDLFSELSVAYTHMLSEDADVFAYLGYPGEPAFGPVAFMHRPSSLYNPNAPISHHWQDATHILFGVSTLGFRYKDFKLEGSLFTGTEPDEDRYNFDEPRFNSWSSRLSYNPSPAWALQVSQAWIKDAHATGLREDINRTTASAIHSLRWGGDNALNTTAVWGYNKTVGGHHPNSHSMLLETALTLNKTAFYGKYEWVEKSTGDLLLDESVYGHGELFPINAFTLGIQQNLLNALKTNLSVGVQGSLSVAPHELDPVYGDNPMGFQAYLRIYPERMQ